MPAHILRLFLPLTLVMLLTVFVGLPDTESHAQTAEDAAAGQENDAAPEVEGTENTTTGAATEAAPAGDEAAIGQPAGDVPEAAEAEPAAEGEADGDDHENDAKDTPWEDTTAPAEATAFLEMIGNGRFAEAYDAGSPLMRSTRTAEALKVDMTEEGFLSVQSVEWDNGVATQGGLRLDGTAKLADGSTLPLYAIVLEEGTRYKVLDVQSAESFATRMSSGTANGLDWLVGTFLLALIGALFFII